MTSKKPPDKYLCVIKNTMKNLYKHGIDPNIIGIIRDAVDRTSKIVFHTYNFLNLYFMYLYKNRFDFPYIDEHYITTIMFVVSSRIDKRGRKPKKNTQKTINTLTHFYNQYYLPLINPNDIVHDDKLKQILLYEAKDIVKNINVNISEHYVQYINKFVNVIYSAKDDVNKIRNNKAMNENEKAIKTRQFWADLRKVKNDILNVKDKVLTSDVKYHQFILKNKPVLIPDKKKFSKNSIYYDVKANPQDYLRPLFKINTRIDNINDIIKITELVLNKNKKSRTHKLFHVLPMRTSIIPKYVTIDTFALARLIIREDTRYYFGDITGKSFELWSKLFNLNSSIFRKKGFTFHRMIKTDGISCSLLFIKLDQNGNPIDLKKISKKSKKATAKLVNSDRCEYIEDTNITNEMRTKTIVAIDPNHGNLISCMAKNDKADITINVPAPNSHKTVKIKYKSDLRFRYTRDQRNVETKNNKYKKIRENLKKETRINNRTVEAIESSLSVHNSKTCNFDDFSSYLRTKVNMNRLLYNYYGADIFRKLKMNIYINTQKSESKMIANFTKIFGSTKNVLIVFGDYDTKDTMHGCEPTIAKRLRKLLIRHGFEVYKINEYNTSKLCNRCCCENERFKYVKGKDGKDHLLWGLLRCTNVNCKTIHNRDHNSSRNMLKITKSIFKGRGRQIEYKKYPI